MKNRKVTKNKNYNFILLNSNTHILDDDGLCVCVFICAIFSLSLSFLSITKSTYDTNIEILEKNINAKRERRGEIDR